jgi:phytoene synthase
VREVAHEPLPGELRLQWWREVVNGERRDEARANPVAAALLDAIERHPLAVTSLLDLIEAHRFDLYDAPMATLADLEAYARQTCSAVIALAAQTLAGADMKGTADPAGIACAIVSLLQRFPNHAARRQLYVPSALLDHHGVPREDIFAGKSSQGLTAALADLRNLARRHLVAAGEHVPALPEAALPAFLPVALVRPSLDRLERCTPFAPVDLPPWRRQWLIWRAARNPARIAP